MYFVYELYFTVLSLLSIYTFCLAEIHAEDKKTLVFNHSSECYGYRPDSTYIFVQKAEKTRMTKINMTQTERRNSQ